MIGQPCGENDCKNTKMTLRRIEFCSFSNHNRLFQVIIFVGIVLNDNIC